ncbi:MAG: DUF4169 family protein [Proteobacteria bacterium]|nr:DUF4169 family protein [Pseudomonadota bacterium]
MAAEIINLRRARKLKSRVENEAKASANRKLFGQTKAEKRLREATRKLEDRELDGRRRITPAVSGREDGQE